MRYSKGEEVVRKGDMPSATLRYHQQGVPEKISPKAVMVLASHTFPDNSLLEQDAWLSWETS